MATTETFANLPATTVTSGGHSAPASGTSETWTVASSAPFPSASTGVTQFHVADPAAATELIAVTNVSGTTWTVTRGAESSTPVAHVGVFTVRQVVSAGTLGEFVQDPMTTLGDVITGGVSGVPARLAGNTGSTANYLKSTGSGGVATAPAWGTIAAGDLPAATTSAQGAVKLRPTSTLLPQGWDTQWQIAKAAALAATGTAKVVVLGDSYIAGQSSGTVTDCLTYGFAGRLDTSLATTLGGYAEGYTIANCQPGTGTLTEPSSPYGTPASSTASDGGVSQLWQANSNVAWLTITAPVHPVTGANPAGMDLFTMDFNTNQWSYAVDGGGSTTVTGTGSGTVGNGIMRRTAITFTGNTTHTVALTQISSNGLIFCGHVTYYATTGLGMFRAGWPGARSVDFATGGGLTASSTGGVSGTPDHIIPWAGTGPSSTPANNNVYASFASGYPFSRTDLVIIHVGANDCTYGTSPVAMRNAITRMINAFRRSIPASSSTSGTSILILGAPYASEYSDNQGSGVISYEWQTYKTILSGLAESYGCAWIDLQEVFGETPVTQGLMTSGQVHPTQNGAGAGGGDGHLAIAQAIEGAL